MNRTVPPPDQAVREAIVRETGRNVSVQAGAGTGKTTLMVQRVAALVGGGMPMERIAVVTFTDAAAAELRLRIRRVLRQEADAGSSPCARALDNMASAWVSTIHGFASRLLKEYFNLTGVDPAFTTTESHFTPVEIGREWDSWLLSLDPPDAWMELIAETGTDVQKLIALGIEERRWLDAAAKAGGEMAAESLFREFMDTHGEAVESVMDQCSDTTDRLYDGAARFLGGLREIMREMPLPDPDRIMSVYGAVNLGCGSAANWTDKEEAKSVLRGARERFREIAGVIGSGRLTELSWEMAGDFASRLRQKWDRDRSRLSYDDLLFAAWSAVSRSGTLARMLSERFDHILIDEFQDTSRQQTRLFLSFLQKNGSIPQGSITVVADDKQSIYGWRNADIETYSEFREGLERDGALSCTITTNFRSSRCILRFVNGFGEILFGSPEPEEAPFGCDYSPIEPRPGAAEGEPVRVVRLPVLPSQLKGTRSAPSWLAELQGAWFADMVRKGLDSGGSPEDYALLFRTGTHLHHFVDALEREGIPYRVTSTRDFLKRQEIVDLREMIRCLLYPGDTLAWTHTLRSLYFGIPDDTVSRALASGYSGMDASGEDLPGPVSTANAVLRRLRSGILSLPLGDFLMELLYQTPMMAVICAEGHQVTRRLGNLQHILEQVICGMVETPSDLLHLLDERLTPRRPEEPSRVPPEGGAVTLSSIHSSKGLDWKHVVLASMPSSMRSRRESVVSYEHGEIAAFDFGMSLDDGDRVRVRSPFWPEITSKEKARSVAEARRLIYVAVTRARDSLSILAEPIESEGISDASILWDCIMGAVDRDPGCCALEELQSPGPSEPIPLRREIRESVEPGIPGRDAPLFRTDPETVGWQTGGAVVGDMVHQVLEKIDLENPESWFASHGEYLEGLYGEDFREVRDLCLAFFGMELPFQLGDSEVIGREYPYIVRTPGGLKKRYIDLLVRTRTGGLVVVDYKTDDLDGVNSDSIVEGYMKTQRHYMEDMRSAFGEEVRGYLVFLRHRRAVEVPHSGVPGFPAST